MTYKALITNLRNVRPHPNADRVQLATCWGSQVVVGLDNHEDQLGVYFPTDGQLSEDFCRENNLFRKSEMNKDKDKSGFFSEKRRVRTQKFRGEISDGYWTPIESLGYLGVDLSGLNHGEEYDALGGIPFCAKYINPQTKKKANKNNNANKPSYKLKAPMFKRHYDTAHFARKLSNFDADEYAVITEKVHGTSGRTGKVQIVDPKKSFFAKLMEKLGYQKPPQWAVINGSRKVDFLPNNKRGTNPYHDPTIREKAGKLFEDHLQKGETVYYEIVGFEPTGASIMEGGDNKEIGKEYVKLYGERTEWTYGCAPEEFDVYVYRMTLTNEEGHSVDYSWDLVKEKCELMGVKHVPELWKGTLNELTAFSPSPQDFEDDLVEVVDRLAEGQSTITPTHMREGICVRINDRAYKHKSTAFKILEGIIKDSGVEDLEEAS